MSKHQFTVKSQAELEKCFNLMKELRPHLSLEEYISIYQNAHQHDGYEIVAIEEGENILALMGYRFLFDFVRGKHVYIDDLVSTEKSRSTGLGAELLSYAEKIALENDCNSLRLCVVLGNTGGIKFYERNGWSKRAFAYVKKLK